MGEELTQDKRIASLTTPLGKDKLALTTFDGTEGLSELFEFCIDALRRMTTSILIRFRPVMLREHEIGRGTGMLFRRHRGRSSGNRDARRSLCLQIDIAACPLVADTHEQLPDLA